VQATLPSIEAKNVGLGGTPNRGYVNCPPLKPHVSPYLKTHDQPVQRFAPNHTLLRDSPRGQYHPLCPDQKNLKKNDLSLFEFPKRWLIYRCTP